MNPIHPHCGPFNAMASNVPENPIDRACYFHDLAYQQMLDEGKNPYLGDGLKADERFIEMLPNNIGSVPYASAFRAKKMFLAAWKRLRKNVIDTGVDNPALRRFKDKYLKWRQELEWRSNNKNMSYRKRSFRSLSGARSKSIRRYSPMVRVPFRRAYYIRYNMYRPLWKKWSQRRRKYYRGRRRYQ